MYLFNIIWSIKIFFYMSRFAYFSSLVILSKNLWSFYKIVDLNFPSVCIKLYVEWDSCISEHVTCASLAKSTKYSTANVSLSRKLNFALLPEYVTLCALYYCLLNNVRYIHVCKMCMAFTVLCSRIIRGRRDVDSIPVRR